MSVGMSAGNIVTAGALIHQDKAPGRSTMPGSIPDYLPEEVVAAGGADVVAGAGVALALSLDEDELFPFASEDLGFALP